MYYIDKFWTGGYVTNKEIIEKINQWQSAGFVPDVTCPRSSWILDHGGLVPEEKDGKVILVCKECAWIQEYIPKEILGTCLEERRREVEKAREEIIRAAKK